MAAWASHREGGIPNYIYSLDTIINPSTYQTLDKPGYWGVHAIGEVWAEMLWVVQQRLIGTCGFSETILPPTPNADGSLQHNDFYRPQTFNPLSGPANHLVPKHGNSLLMQLVLDGKKLQPCSPGFFDARGAVVQADEILTRGETSSGFVESGCMNRPSFMELVSSEARDEECSQTPPVLSEVEKRGFMYGIPLEGLKATQLHYPVDAVRWPSQSLSAEAPPLLSTAEAPHPATPPDGWYYPIAPTYQLNATPDDRFRRRYRYSTVYDPTDAPTLRSLYSKVVSPPNVSASPAFVDGRAVIEPIPGMIQMIPGIPYVFEVSGDPFKCVTVGCVQTLKSLEAYPNHAEVVTLSNELQNLTWGSCGDPTSSCPAIYTYPSFKRNDRSSTPANSSYAGSYNLASTVVKGQGQGTVAPAVQINTPEAGNHIRKTLHVLCDLYKHIMPLCISREEWELISYASAENNVFTFGGGNSGPVGCQLNISSIKSGGELKGAIGEVQGSWHVDQGDDPLTHTLLVMLFRIPPGSDPGAFCLGRPGLYARELNSLVCFVVLKGNDIHSGHAPCVDAITGQQYSAFEEWGKAQDFSWDVSGEENRAVYVCYTQKAALTRHSRSSVFSAKDVFFGNACDPVIGSDAKSKALNYAVHGKTILGTSYKERMYREVAMQAWNQSVIADIGSSQIIGGLWEHKTASSEDDFPLPPHPLHQHKASQQLRGRYQNFREVIEAYSITILKHDLKIRKVQPSNASSNHTSFPLERGRPAAPTRRSAQTNVSSICERHLHFIYAVANEGSNHMPVEGHSAHPKSSRQKRLRSEDGEYGLPTCRRRREKPTAVPKTPIVREGARHHVVPQNERAQAVNPQVLSSGDEEDGEVELGEVAGEQSDGKEEYEVEEIVDSILLPEDNQVYYKVRWKGYGPADDNFLPETQLQDCTEILAHYQMAESRSLATFVLQENSKEMKILQEILHPDFLRTASTQVANTNSFGTSTAGTDAFAALAENTCLNDKVAALDLSVVDDEKVAVTITHALQAASCIPKMIVHMEFHETSRKMFLWETGRMYLEIYNWYMETGPAIADQLFHHMLSEGDDILRLRSPRFHALVIQIHDYFTALQHLKAEQAKRHPSTDDIHTLGLKVEHLKIVPSGVHPFDGNTLHLKMGDLSLPDINLCHIQQETKRMPKLMQQCFVDFIFNTLLDGHITTSDRFFNSPKVRKFDQQHIRAQFLIQSGFLSTVVKSFQWNDAILAVGEWKELLASPRHIFAGAGRDTEFAQAICRDPTTTFASLDIWLNSHVQSSSIQAADQLGNVLYDHMKYVASSHFEPTRSKQIRRQRKTQQVHLKPHQAKRSQSVLSVNTLVPSSEAPEYGMAALLLHEALGKMRGQAGSNSYIRWILDGYRPSLGQQRIRATKNPDHYNPLRMCGEYSGLFKQAISPMHATSRLGISSILTFMSTGQGSMTKAFLQKNNMEFNSLSECVATYTRALLNAQAEGQSGLPCFNKEVWGQNCYHFGLRLPDSEAGGETLKSLTPSQKFPPFFEKSIQDDWTDFLGPLAGKDPRIETSKHQEWSKALEWIAKQDLLCFGSNKTGTLTGLQFCNNLVDLGICKPPSPYAMACFIAKHRMMGAFKALKSQGFQIDPGSEEAVKAAYLCFHTHMETNLSIKDRTDISFSPIISEHLLCKQTRFSNLLHNEKCPTLLDLSKDQGQLPFPAEADRIAIGHIISDLQKSV
ncbi:hypothetical protein BDN67DRAFT_1072857 [Paxillus ammoniavirescens]|nr:hypothetical protein BDN67DRAFT_1072857 [Paxillus ammoniavirescens]